MFEHDLALAEDERVPFETYEGPFDVDKDVHNDTHYNSAEADVEQNAALENLLLRNVLFIV